MTMLWIFGAWESLCEPSVPRILTSLTIVSFAMLTGKPPFQSATADEIYRRAREREYDWPKLDTSENFISQETKDLVAALLEPPEQRPDPDTIVQHPFFTCGWMPQSEEMTPSLRDKHPDPDRFLSVGARGGRNNLYLRNLKKLCIKCEVGPWNTYPSGYISTYRECADEEKAGFTPKVPLPEDVVYRPFHEWLEEQATLVKPAGQRSSSGAMEGVVLSTSNSRPENVLLPSSRPTTQSFAAQQRARPQTSTTNPSSRAVKPRQPSSETYARPGPSTQNRSAKSSNSQKVKSETSEDAADVENRLAADLVQQLNSADNERKALEAEAPTISLEICESLFNPKEKLESLPNTKPDLILEGLRHLQVELERALNSRTMAMETKRTPSLPTIVVKWVDYTNKFGLGYILSNGSVGCIFKATPADTEDLSKGLIPPCCVVVREAERHLQNRANEAYVDRYQLVPISGPNIEFYENRGEKGVFRGKVNPQNYKVQVGPNGEVYKLARGQDDWDNRKREKIMLWKKFANYMTAYGRDQDYPFDDALTRTQDKTEFVAAGNVVTFYQRWGDVGCWFFADGHFQVISACVGILIQCSQCLVQFP
jgi:serine/threonine protein kinase